ncbi:energy transducer TonB [Bacteroides sp.]
MKRGKQTCRILKEIRRQIAEANDIEFITSECQYQGDCLGTCPKCEAEVRYLEQQLERKRMAGKAITVMGISAGLIALAPSQMVKAEPIQQEVYQNSDSISPKTNRDVIEEEPYEGELFTSMAVYPGGDDDFSEFFKREINYPGCTQPRIRTSVEFRIQEDGTPKFRGAFCTATDSVLSKEIEQIIMEMPRWIPATLDGKAKQEDFLLPIVFTVHDQPTENNKKIARINETPPEFPGGMKELMKYLTQQIKPDRPVCQGEMMNSARVIVQFNIGKDGSVIDPIVIRSSEPTLDKEALRIVNQLPKWKPATIRNKPMIVRYTVPVIFKMQ